MNKEVTFKEKIKFQVFISPDIAKEIENLRWSMRKGKSEIVEELLIKALKQQ